MSYRNNQQTLYLGTQTHDTFNVSSLYAEGELGAMEEWRDRRYQRVQLDSGATDSTTVGAVAANQLAYWKDRDNYLVTNDSRFAFNSTLANSGYRNAVAGIFRCAVTAGYYCDILQGGNDIPVADGDNTFAAGDFVVAEATATSAAADAVNAGTAPTVQVIGMATGVTDGTDVPVDVDIQAAP